MVFGPHGRYVRRHVAREWSVAHVNVTMVRLVWIVLAMSTNQWCVVPLILASMAGVIGVSVPVHVVVARQHECDHTFVLVWLMSRQRRVI